MATIAELTVLVSIDAKSAVRGAAEVNRALSSIGASAARAQQAMRTAGTGLNTGPAVRSAQQLNNGLRQVRTTAGQMRNTQVRFNTDPARQGVRQLTNGLNQVRTSAGQLRTTPIRFNTAPGILSANQLNNSLRQVRTTAGQMGTTQVRVNTGPARQALSGLRASMRSSSETATRAAAQITGAFAGVMAGLAAQGVGMVAEFDKSQAAVRAFTGATAAEMKKLEEAARSAAKGTSFTATEASNALIELGKTGFNATEAVQGLPPVLQLATAGQLEMARAADISSTIMNTFGLSAKDLGGVTDALAAAATNSATNVNKLGFTFQRMSAAANAAGLNVEEAAEAAALMAEAGFRGTAAGTGLNKILLELNAESGKGRKLFESYGVELRKSDGSMRRLSDITLDAQKAGISYNEVIEAFGLNHGPKMGAVLGLTEKKLNAVKNATTDTTGAGAEMARIMEDNLFSAFKRLQSAWQEFQLVLLKDTGIDSALSRMVDGLARLINVVNTFGSQHPLVAKVFLAFLAFLGLTAGITAMVLALKLLVLQLGLMGIIMTGLLFTGIGAMIAVLAAFAAALALAWQSSEAFRERVSSGFQVVRQAASNLRQVLAALWGAVQRGVDMWRIATGRADAFGNSLQGGVAMAQAAGGAITGLGNAARSVFSGFGRLAGLSDQLSLAVARVMMAFSEQGLSGALAVARAEFARLGPAILAIIREALLPLVSWFASNLPQIVETILAVREMVLSAAIRLFSALVEALPRIVPPLVAGLLATVMQIVNFIVSAAPFVIEAAVALFTGLIVGAAQIIPDLVVAVINLVQSIQTGFLNSVPLIIQAGLALLLGLIDGLVAGIPRLIEYVTTIVPLFVETLTVALPLLAEAGVKILLALIDGLLVILPQLIDFALELLPLFIESALALLPVVLRAGYTIIRELAKGLLERLPDIIDFGVELIPRLANAIERNLPRIIEAGVTLIEQLLTGLINKAPAIISWVLTELIPKIIMAVMKAAPQLRTSGLRLLGTLLAGMGSGLPLILGWIARKLGPRIIRAVISIQMDMKRAGIRLITGLASGMVAGIPKIATAAGKVAAAITRFLPKSPADVGPFSGKGAPEPSGARIVAGLSKGILSELREIDRAADALMRPLDARLEHQFRTDVPENVSVRLRKIEPRDQVVRIELSGPEEMKRLIRKLERTGNL